jgi:hypothetical protein
LKPTALHCTKIKTLHQDAESRAGVFSSLTFIIFDTDFSALGRIVKVSISQWGGGHEKGLDIGAGDECSFGIGCV